MKKQQIKNREKFDKNLAKSFITGQWGTIDVGKVEMLIQMTHKDIEIWFDLINDESGSELGKALIKVYKKRAKKKDLNTIKEALHMRIRIPLVSDINYEEVDAKIIEEYGEEGLDEWFGTHADILSNHIVNFISQL